MESHHVLVHRLYRHELGYRVRSQHREAGSFIYVPLKIARDFFPPLRPDVLNDQLLLEIILPDKRSSVMSQYVYHNDSFFGGTRNEYRLYISQIVNQDERFLVAGNIIIIESIDIEGRIVFNIRLFSERENRTEHSFLHSLLRNLNNAVVPARSIPFLRADATPLQPTEPPSISDSDLVSSLENPVATERRTEGVGQVTRIIRDAAFRRLVLNFYSFRCAINNNAIRHNDLINIQACHIIPVPEGGSDHPVNGIALSRDIHWAFDRGFFTILNNYSILVHPKSQSYDELRSLNGRCINLPRNERARPHQDSLTWHRKNLYGKFLHI